MGGSVTGEPQAAAGTRHSAQIGGGGGGLHVTTAVKTVERRDEAHVFVCMT